MPVLPGRRGGLDRLVDVARAAFVHCREYVILVVWHHGLEGLAGPHFLAADHHRRVDALGLHLLEPKTQLLALGCPGCVRLHRLVLGRRRAEKAGRGGHRERL